MSIFVFSSEASIQEYAWWMCATPISRLILASFIGLFVFYPEKVTATDWHDGRRLGLEPKIALPEIARRAVTVRSAMGRWTGPDTHLGRLRGFRGHGGRGPTRSIGTQVRLSGILLARSQLVACSVMAITEVPSTGSAAVTILVIL